MYSALYKGGTKRKINFCEELCRALHVVLQQANSSFKSVNIFRPLIPENSVNTTIKYNNYNVYNYVYIHITYSQKHNNYSHVHSVNNTTIIHIYMQSKTQQLLTYTCSQKHNNYSHIQAVKNTTIIHVYTQSKTQQLFTYTCS